MDFTKIIIFVTFVNDVFAVLEMVPARTQVTYYNPQYVVFVNASTHRTRRGGAVVTDLYGIMRHAWGNNVTMQIVMYEYLSNEYKRSFVQMTVKLCDFVTKDPFIAPIIKETVMGKLTCPYRAGVWSLMNMTVGVNNVPPNFPFRKGRINLDFVLTVERTRLAAGVTYIEVKERGKKERSKQNSST